MSGLPTAPDHEIGLQPPPSLPRAPVPIVGIDRIIYNPVIIVLVGYLEKVHPGALQEAVASALEEIPWFMHKLKIKDAESFLVFANDLLKWVPHENFEGKDIYDILCVFYYVLDQPALTGLQTRIHPDEVGQPLTWLSSWIVVYAQLIGLFMDTPASLTDESLETFKNSPKYNFEEALVPEGGFRTFNDFFARRLKPNARPIDSPDDDRVVVYPADCTFDNSVENGSIISIESEGIVNIKNLPWTISSLLQGSNYAHEFGGGIWMHAFLDTFNYHRQHAPVSGTVLEAKNIQGAAYLGVDQNCQPVRTICRPDAPNTPGYQFLQLRGVIVIDSPVLGKVAMLPIGMAMLSSVKLMVRKGDVVKKGDEVSYFLFGGSDVICVFQAKARLTRDDLVASSGNTYSKMGTVLARAPE